MGSSLLAVLDKLSKAIIFSVVHVLLICTNASANMRELIACIICVEFREGSETL